MKKTDLVMVYSKTSYTVYLTLFCISINCRIFSAGRIKDKCMSMKKNCVCYVDTQVIWSAGNTFVLI